MNRVLFPLVLVVVVLTHAPVPGAIIGTNVPAEPLTPGRIATLPAAQQSAWIEYLKRSEAQRRADQAALQREMHSRGLTNSTVPPSSRGVGSMPLGRSAAWYGMQAGLRVADIIVSFQTPSGGWSKNLDLADHPRAAGEGFAPDNSSRFVAASDNDAMQADRWSYVGTIDNSATTTELRFLARVITALPEKQRAQYRASFERGIEYLLAAQNPNGGWPQVWPLQGGYHDAITFNDGAMLNVLSLLSDLSAGRGDFSFTSAELRSRASASAQRGLKCILDSQIVAGGSRTVWCQQHDALTLLPTSARNYEMPALCSGESAGIVAFLMQQPSPDSNTVVAVKAAVAWFEQTQIRDVEFRKVDKQGRLLVPAHGKGPLWARYYEIGSNRPIFGERDKTIHDRVDEISMERRNGYAWFTDYPGDVLKKYQKWNAAR
jgi:PelA/Pel-15E family pectate lyase